MVSGDPFLPLTRELLDRIAPPDRASAIPPFQPYGRALRWARVSGGRAVHVFTPGEEIPMCGVDPVRGKGGVLARWITEGYGAVYQPRFYSWSRRGRLGAHGECQRRATAWMAQRRAELLEEG